MHVYRCIKLYLFLLVLLMGLGFLSLQANWRIIPNRHPHYLESELNHLALEVATRITNVDDTFILDQCEIQNSKKPVWTIRWTGPDNEFVEVQLAANDYSLLSLFDGRKLTPILCQPAITDSETAVMMAESYLRQLHEDGYFTLPQGRVLSRVEDDGSLWKVIWTHAIDSLPIVGDHLIVQLDKATRNLVSIDLSWTPSCNIESITYYPSNQDLLRMFSGTSLGDIVGPTEELISSDGSNRLERIWRFTGINDKGDDVVSISVSASTGNIVNVDTTRTYNGYSVVFEGGNDFQESADWSEFTLYADHYLTNYQSQPTVSTMSYYWSWENVIVYIGHGGYSGSYTTLAPQGPGGDLFYPSDVPSNMDQAILVYASACQSGCYATQENSVNLYLSNTTLNNGADAFFGWIGSPLNSEATTFDKYFWSAAANGASFEQCRNYANGKISSTANPVVLGNKQAHLEREDVSWNYYLGSAPYRKDATLTYDDENAFYTDYDYFRFDSVGTHEITIMVTPSRSEFDVGFKVYSSSYQLLYTVNSRGGGGYERITYSGTGTYHIQVYIANAGLGGVYDLKVTCAAS